MFWIGSYQHIAAANALAFDAYIAATPLADRRGAAIPNETKSWAVPERDAAGDWVIPAYPGLPPPTGCRHVESITWPPER